MKAVANVLSSMQQPEVSIVHKDEKIQFSINVFGRNSFSDVDYDVFEYINNYWEQLPLHKQDIIFSIYKDIHYGFDNMFNNNDLSEFLSNKIKELLDLHDLNDMKDWITMKTNVIIPNTFTVDYTHSIDNNTSREKTYTHSDYVKLITLSTALKTVIPIWGEYINSVRKETGNDFKEFYAFQLLNKSSIIKSIPMEKLKTYIDHIIENDKSNANNTLNNISSEDYSYWLLALVCIRRLCVGDIRGLDPKTNLITYIYKSIIQKIKNVDSLPETTVKFKLTDDRGSNNDDKTSTLERYKINTDLSPEDIVELEFSISDIPNITRKLSHNASMTMLERSLYTSRKLEKELVLVPQMMLVSWVMKPIISPRGLLYLNKNKIVEALAATETILWARNHKYLAILATSYSSVDDDTMLISPVDSKTKIDPDLMMQLEQLYPSVSTINKKLNKSPNFAVQSIDKFISVLVTKSWRATADSSLLQDVFNTDIKKVPILPDIKNHLARFIIEIGQRNWL